MQWKTSFDMKLVRINETVIVIVVIRSSTELGTNQERKQFE